MTATTFDHQHNRRSAVRVRDRILLAVTPMDGDHYQALAESYGRGVSLYNQESLRDIHLYLGAHNALARIKEKDEDLADFLQHLDHKLNYVLAAVSGKGSPMDRFQAREVSLSGAGLAWVGAEQYEKGSPVEAQLILLPDSIHLYTVCRVVDCRPVADGTRVALEFDMIMDEDRETIIGHVFRLQQLELRNRRLRAEHAELGLDRDWLAGKEET